MDFNDKNFLLSSPLARHLYFDFAENLPIIDYHSHLSAKEIAEDKHFRSITELWLGGDHYKWRLMRNCGIEEKYITGDASDIEKFRAFSKILPLAAGNPIFTWCHMELKKYFRIDTGICEENADSIFAETQKVLQSGKLTARTAILSSNVKTVCTTDDPADDLKYHLLLAENNFGVNVLPTFRPDKALNIEAAGFKEYISLLTGKTLPSFTDIKNALTNKMDFFASAGCRISDHALASFLFRKLSDAQCEKLLLDVLQGKTPSEEQAEGWKTSLLLFLAKEYHKRDWAMQLHFNCQRNVNTKMFEKLGPDTGYDCINSSTRPDKLASLLNELGEELPKTIVYSLDPNDDKLLNTVINCFQGTIQGKLQHGSAWWFNDTETGIRTHLKTLSEYSVLGNFIGMLTDSRSFTSYIRHYYFRRILCDYLAKLVDEGKYFNSETHLKLLVENICYKNAENYLNI